MEEKLIKKDKPHSYEYGIAKNRHKVYYNDVSDLILHMQKLKNANLDDYK